MKALQCAARVLFGANGAAAVSGSGPCAVGLAKAIRTIGLDRWPRVVEQRRALRGVGRESVAYPASFAFRRRIRTGILGACRTIAATGFRGEPSS